MKKKIVIMLIYVISFPALVRQGNNEINNNNNILLLLMIIMITKEIKKNFGIIAYKRNI